MNSAIDQTQNTEDDQAHTRDIDRSFATTLVKGIAILEAFQPGDGDIGNTELANRTGLSRPTTARLSATLAELGYLVYDEQRAKFRLGKRVLRLGWPMLADMHVRQVARPLMQELAASVRGTVSLGVIDGLSAVYVETARGGEITPRTPEIGSLSPILRTAMGRALTTLLTSEERAALETRFSIEVPQMWHDYGANYRNGILQCATKGFCVSEGDLEPSIHVTAVPLFRSSDTGDCFAFNCGVAAFRLKPGELVNEIGPRLGALGAAVRATMQSAVG